MVDTRTQAVGLHRATELEGGVQAWVAAGLRLDDGPADVRPSAVRKRCPGADRLAAR